MYRSILAIAAVVCLGLVAYYVVFVRERDTCAFGGWKRTIGVEASSTTGNVQQFQGALHLSAAQVKEFDVLLNDYAAKFDTLCRDFKMGTIKSDEYNCRRDNMEKALNNVRALNSSLDALSKGFSESTQKDAAQLALKNFDALARSGYAEGCGSKMSVSPTKIEFSADTLERSIRITNSGNRDFTYSIGELPDSFVPVLPSGHVPNGDLVLVSIIRTNRPAQKSTFTVSNNFNDTAIVEIGVSMGSSNPYKRIASEGSSHGTQSMTLANALRLADEHSPGAKANAAARYVIAANILENTDNVSDTERAYQQAIALDPLLKDSSVGLRFSVDDEISRNYMAALILKGLDKEHIRFDAKNGVLTLKGRVKNPQERQVAEEVANEVPNISRVVNEIVVKHEVAERFWAGSAREDATERLENAATLLHEIMGMPDKGIPEEVLEHAKCVAVVPHMVKGGFIFGGKGGKGVAICRTADGWSAPAFITISGGNWGLQIGVEAVDLVMIIQNEKGMQKLLSSNFHVGADASAAAGPVGRHAEAGTNWKMDTEILTYSRAKGVFAGLTLEGASIRQDSDSRHAIYGSNVTTRALLLGKVPAPSAAQPFLAEIRGAKAQAVTEGKADAKEKNKD